jgi:hypothetical protein
MSKNPKWPAMALSALVALVACTVFVAIVGVAGVSLIHYALGGQWLYLMLYLVAGDLVLISLIVYGMMFHMGMRTVLPQYKP